jgi:threonine/homoserine/homoserine lactone efflux protein
MMEQILASLPSAIWQFVMAALIIELTPGPNMTYLAIVSVSNGWRAGFATVLGVALGLTVVGIIAAFGVAALVQSSDLLYEALRWAGVIYLLWLAYEGWHGEEFDTGPPGDARNFMRGLVTNLLNPKAAVFYVAVLPSFIDADKPVLAQTLVLSAVYVAIATVIHASIVLLGGSLEPLLTNPARETLIRRVLSVFLGLVAIWFAWSTAR